MKAIAAEQRGRTAADPLSAVDRHLRRRRAGDQLRRGVGVLELLRADPAPPLDAQLAQQRELRGGPPKLSAPMRAHSRITVCSGTGRTARQDTYRMDRLFDPPEKRPGDENVSGGPLAARMRPRTLDEVRRPGAPARPRGSAARAIEAGRLHSHDPVGPARDRQDDAGATWSRRRPPRRSMQLSAVRRRRQGRARGGRRRARERAANGRRTVLFVDEIHRFNKAQQDALLPGVEDGAVTLIGATTENPMLRGQRAPDVAQPALPAAAAGRRRRPHPASSAR